jgi:hypothetical protein
MKLEPKTLKSPKVKLQEYFPVIFRQKSQSIQAEAYFREVMHELEENKLMEELLSEEQIEVVEDLLLKEEEYRFLFYE